MRLAAAAAVGALTVVFVTAIYDDNFFSRFVEKWQTLITGILALAAAGVTVRVMRQQTRQAAEDAAAQLKLAHELFLAQTGDVEPDFSVAWVPDVTSRPGELNVLVLEILNRNRREIELHTIVVIEPKSAAIAAIHIGEPYQGEDIGCGTETYPTLAFTVRGTPPGQPTQTGKLCIVLHEEAIDPAKAGEPELVRLFLSYIVRDNRAYSRVTEAFGFVVRAN